MGVKGLRKYFEQECSNTASFRVDLRKLATEYRLKYKRDPEIVVDAYSSIYKIYGKLDWVCGGEYTEFVTSIKEFISSFEALGIKLIFFFDGFVQSWKRKEWVQRRMTAMRKVHSIFNNLKRLPVGQISYCNRVLPEGMGYVLAHILKTHNCKVRRSIQECDDEIVLYAEKNKCLAILADDSDFSIYQKGAQYLLSLEKLNLRTMTTVAYDGSALAKKLQLKRQDLPALASLMGNDFISIDDLKGFHHRLTGMQNPPKSTVILALACYIREMSCQGDTFLNELAKVSDYVFGTPARAKDIRKSILSYSPTELMNSDSEKFDNVLAAARKKCIEMTLPGIVENVLVNRSYESSTVLEDYRPGNLPPSAKVLRGIRQRMYGVLLKEYSGRADSEFVHEWCMCGPHTLDSALEVPAIKPPFKAPLLLDLWNNVASEDVIDSKFTLLAWMASEHLKRISLRTLPPQIICALCALCFLFHDAKILNESDVVTLAAVVVDTQAMSSKELSSIRVYNVDGRGVQLATLFARTITHIYLANCVCGNPVSDENMLHHGMFNGKIFQVAYAEAKVALNPTTPKKGSMANFNLLCRTVLS